MSVLSSVTYGKFGSPQDSLRLHFRQWQRWVLCQVDEMLNSPDTAYRFPTNSIADIGSEWVTFWKTIL